MGIIRRFEETRIMKGMTEVSRYAIPFVSQVGFGFTLAVAKGAREFHNWSQDPDNYKSSIDKYTLFGFLGIPVGRAIDRWLIATGGETMAATRFHLATSNIPLKLKVGGAVGVAYTGFQMTHSVIESVMQGTTVGNQRSPKPSWMPLPVYAFLYG